MKITIWTMLDEEKPLYKNFNHIEDGWSGTNEPLPIKKEYTNQKAWQNHPWKREFGWLINGVVVRDNFQANNAI